MTDPGLSAVEIRVFWLPTVTPFVVPVIVAPEPFSEAFWLEALAGSDQTEDEVARYLAFGPPGLDLQVTVLSAEPDRPLAIVAPIDGDLPARLDVARRLWRCLTTGAFESPGTLTSQRRARLTETLRALDGRMAGATIREIAAELYGSDRLPTGREWKAHDLRSRTKRLVDSGLALMRGGYRKLLRPPKAGRDR